VITGCALAVGAVPTVSAVSCVRGHDANLAPFRRVRPAPGDAGRVARRRAQPK
jgi:hypothetical protein